MPDEDDDIDFEEEDAYRDEDDDSEIESDGDICDRCMCNRTEHENGKGACSCGRCKKFKSP